MRVRLMPVLALFLGAATAWAAQPDRPATQPGGGTGDKGTAGDKGGMKAVSLDGEWTVVSVARDGSAVTGADKMTVTIRGNVVTFGGAGANDTAKMKALRLDFGPTGTVRVTEAGTDGKFGGGTGGAGEKDNKGAQPGAGGAGGQPGNTNMPGPLTGVYVMTPDYLAISVFGTGTGGTGGTGTGGTGTTRPGTGGDERPGAGTTRPGTGTTQPGTAGNTTQPGTGTGTTQPGTGTGTTQPGTAGAGTGPQLRTHMSVILKRSGGSRP